MVNKLSGDPGFVLKFQELQAQPALKFWRRQPGYHQRDPFHKASYLPDHPKVSGITPCYIFCLGLRAGLQKHIQSISQDQITEWDSFESEWVTGGPAVMLCSRVPLAFKCGLRECHLWVGPVWRRLRPSITSTRSSNWGFCLRCACLSPRRDVWGDILVKVELMYYHMLCNRTTDWLKRCNSFLKMIFCLIS